VDSSSEQIASAGSSEEEILEAALNAAQPAAGLTWLDIGCGRGDLLRMIKRRWQPADLHGIDVIDWLDEDLRGEVSFRTVAAEQADDLPRADRVLLVEVIEHLEAPWSTLRMAARLVSPGGWLVVSTPNVTTLRHRLDLALRAQLTSFRADNLPHLSPALPHVTARILGEEDLIAEQPTFAGTDVIPLSGGRLWPPALRHRYPSLTCVSVIVSARRERPRG
jgi:2-polyprenyl-3-methyl-5-hydroxy-6-metoxy-1,4-benzoquinol methylase